MRREQDTEATQQNLWP